MTMTSDADLASRLAESAADRAIAGWISKSPNLREWLERICRNEYCHNKTPRKDRSGRLGDLDALRSQLEHRFGRAKVKDILLSLIEKSPAVSPGRSVQPSDKNLVVSIVLEHLTKIREESNDS